MSPRRPQPVRHAGTLSLIALAFGLALAVPSSVAATPASEATEIDALRSTVNELLKRVDTLERELARRPSAGITAAAPRTAARPSRAPVRAPSAPPSRDGTSQVAAPGTVAVDELAAERALERTLTAEGVLLLGPKQFDLEPYLSYARRESRSPALALDPAGTLVALRTAAVRRNEFDLGLRVRAGLPFASQLELDVPYRWVEQSVVAPIGLSDFDAQGNTGSSMGDIKVGIAKTLLRESGWLPDLVGRVVWDTDTGSRENAGVPLGIGFNELRFGLSALKRQDPLAFTAALSYGISFEKNGVKPGDELGLTLGVSLAASPETSLSVALVQSFAQELEINGERVAGSDQVSSVLALGASSILGRRTLLSVSAGIGLTEEAPDYTVYVSLPMRF